MSTKTQKPRAYADTVFRWLKDNEFSLGVLTGTDQKALAAAVQIVGLYSYCSDRQVAAAFRLVVETMQVNARHLAFHAIAHVMDWETREQLWAAADLERIEAPGVALWEPAGYDRRVAQKLHVIHAETR